MSRPQWAVKCVKGKQKGEWLGWRSWRFADTYAVLAPAEDAALLAEEQFGGKWIVVPVPEPEVK